MKNGWTPWSEALRKAGNALQKDLANVDPDAFSAALTEEQNRRHARFLDGLEKYRSHTFRRTLTAPPAIWQSGSIRLLDYGATSAQGPSKGRPVLVVPSLVNRSHIMDLTTGHSFLRYLAENGFQPLLMDWGMPGPVELRKSLDDYIATDLASALDIAVGAAGGKPVPVIGYCMGGTLAVALSMLEPGSVAALLLLATPWDFHADNGGPPLGLAEARPGLEALVSALGYLPVDTLQAMFFSIDPLQSWKKFQAFADMPPNAPEAETFIALEDWLNDGVPLAADVARVCLFEWFLENTPAQRKWTVAGKTVDPARISCPTLGVLPAQDRIVPPASAQALIEAIPGAESLSPRAGHIGMMVGSKAKSQLWSPLAIWLNRH